MTMRRFRVAEDSMRPTLAPGDEVVTTDSREPGVGDLVVFLHPGRDDFWMIKRVVDPPGPIAGNELWVLSENHEATLADSRSLGPIPAGSAVKVVDRLDAHTFEEACGLLASEDAAIAEAIGRFGIPEFWQRDPGLGSLVLLILEQQVSLESGAAMYRRLANATGGVTVESLEELGVDGMRSIGITRQKSGYLHTLAGLVSSGEFDIDSLETDAWPMAREKLLALNGVGPWTADAYLLSALRFPDMFPIGDRALQVGAGEVLGMGSTPDESQLEVLGKPWRPVRAAAARIIWHSYLSERGRVEPPSPFV